MMREKLKFKKLLSEFRTLEYEYYYNQEVLRDAHEYFENYYLKWCDDNGVDLAKLQEEKKSKVANIMQQNTQDHIDTHGRFETNKKKIKHKEVFRSVARKIHPDRIGQDDPRYEDYQEAFKRACRATEQEEWGELFDVVDKYEIEIPDYDEANESIAKDIERMGEKIKSQKMTYSWHLQNCGDDEVCKSRVVKAFLNYMFGWVE
jgi:hypothetical protein